MDDRTVSRGKTKLTMAFSKYLSALRRARRLASSEGGLFPAAAKAIQLFRSSGLQGVKRALSTPDATAVVSASRGNRPTDENDFAFEVPFREPEVRDARSACAIIHAFYPELCAEMRGYLENVPGKLDLYISTTSEQKRLEIATAFSDYEKGSVEVRIFENRGRDIAPKLYGFSDVYERYDLALSLHTKKSPHGGTPLQDWRHYLYEHLLGSPQIVASIFELLKHDHIGMVFPQHLFYLRPILGWGANFASCRALLRKMGVEIKEDIYLEFPTGSMFWCRTAALKTLRDLNLQFQDFDEESGQIDGTLAHAVERAFLYAVEASGYRWAKVALRAHYPLPDTLVPVNSPADISSGLPRVHHRLLP